MLIPSIASSPLAAASVLSLAHLAFWQTPDAINTGHAVLIEVFTGLVAFAMVVVAGVVLAIGLGLLKLRKEVMGHFHEFRGKAIPLIDKSNTLITELTPEIKAITAKTQEIMAKVDVITAHVEAIAGLAKAKAEEFSPTISAANETAKQANETVREANEKTRQQVARINGMVTDTLDATTRLGKAIERGIALPGKEIAGLVAGAKATVDHLMDNSGTIGSLLGRFSNLFKGKQNTAGGGSRPSARPAAAYRSMGSLPVSTQSMPPVHMPTSHGFDTNE